MSTLSASGLYVSLGQKSVLKDIDLTFKSGQVTAIVGPNGAGKSTLLTCLCGLRAPTTGQVFLDQTPLLSMKSAHRAQKLGFLQQNPEIAWAIDVLTMVSLGRTPYAGFNKLTAVDHAAVNRAMAQTDMLPFADRDVTTLSGGERARAILARALAGEPEWLLADEPFDGLDPRHQLEAVKIFREMATTESKGVIVTLHDLTLAARLADTIIVLAEGKTIAIGTPEEALTPSILAKTYGVETRTIMSETGPIIHIVGLSR
ncbi:ABC transporter ATP-binding protein [Microvirga sp. W0021]|uniref:ABC transporter ATP-binding protein n=1 Tax=Hohaiivirga grylli TaxID=3133970 RepID=A0ABV0BKZ5_9HYPH